MSDAEIICGLRAGNSCAWAALYDGYSVRIWRYIACLVGPQHTVVADLVQETVLAAARSAARFDESKGTVWQWLSGIAHNHVSLHWRSEQQISKLRRIVEHLPRGESLLSPNPPDQSPSARLEQDELANLVRATLARLPSDYSELLAAKYLEDLSLAEIQSRTSATSDAVRSKMVRARQLFRDVFERLTQTP
ncbi:MAG: sigma-70 family RNA polymerase sigma factor [Planctomycetaceae bacterium]|nr:sigma-70 family RNA polymerase sigma factor [Planctomycetaceae bacterium]